MRKLPAVRVAVLVVALGALAACTSHPVEPLVCEPEKTATGDSADVPVVTDQPAQALEPAATSLQLAQEAFDRGDHAAAMRGWEDVASGESSVHDRAHALIGMVLLRMLPSSTFVDPRAAEALIAEFEQHVRDHALRDEFGTDIALLRMLAAHERELATLRDANRTLRADLAAREALIHKLRALSVERD